MDQLVEDSLVHTADAEKQGLIRPRPGVLRRRGLGDPPLRVLKPEADEELVLLVEHHRASDENPPHPAASPEIRTTAEETLP